MTQRTAGRLLGPLLLAGLLMAPAAQAIETINFTTGTDLLAACRDAVQGHVADRVVRVAKQAYRAGLCDGYVFGVLAMQLNETANAARLGQPYTPSFCYTAPTFDLEPVERGIVRYLESHPERLHLGCDGLFLEAMRQAYPCPAPAPQPTRQR
jgi:hypothetical protein